MITICFICLYGKVFRNISGYLDTNQTVKMRKESPCHLMIIRIRHDDGFHNVKLMVDEEGGSKMTRGAPAGRGVAVVATAVAGIIYFYNFPYQFSIFRL